jgi:hypothetical protein
VIEAAVAAAVDKILGIRLKDVAEAQRLTNAVATMAPPSAGNSSASADSADSGGAVASSGGAGGKPKRNILDELRAALGADRGSSHSHRATRVKATDIQYPAPAGGADDSGDDNELVRLLRRVAGKSRRRRDSDSDSESDEDGGGSVRGRKSMVKNILAKADEIGSFKAWLRLTSWNTDRNKYESETIAHAVDALLAEGVSRSSKGIEILLCRLAGVHLADETGKWGAADALSATSSFRSLLTRTETRRAMKDATTFERYKSSATGAGVSAKSVSVKAAGGGGGGNGKPVQSNSNSWRAHGTDQSQQQNNKSSQQQSSSQKLKGATKD